MERLIDLPELEILALAIYSEENDSKIYRGFAEGLREHYPGSAKVFDEMADEEVRHRTTTKLQRPFVSSRKSLERVPFRRHQNWNRPARDAPMSPALLYRSIAVMDWSIQCTPNSAISASKSARRAQAG